MAQTNSSRLFEDLIYVLPMLNRTDFCERTGLSYRALSQKIYRYNQGQQPRFTREEEDLVAKYVYELIDKLEILLNTYQQRDQS